MTYERERERESYDWSFIIAKCIKQKKSSCSSTIVSLYQNKRIMPIRLQDKGSQLYIFLNVITKRGNDAMGHVSMSITKCHV